MSGAYRKGIQQRLRQAEYKSAVACLFFFCLEKLNNFYQSWQMWSTSVHKFSTFAAATERTVLILDHSRLSKNIQAATESLSTCNGMDRISQRKQLGLNIGGLRINFKPRKLCSAGLGQMLWWLFRFSGSSSCVLIYFFINEPFFSKTYWKSLLQVEFVHVHVWWCTFFCLFFEQVV